ncbi:MAG TPA: sigma-70 family RNA polymerase sigma factor [Vicinamibacteria bacterium]|jgi:RNA polymerase sigma-70 factor (ECF subfamily)
MEEPEADAQAVARVRAGEAEAFRPLMERHGRAVFRLAFRMTGNQHDAEDVVQETFFRAYRKLDEFEARAQFGSWVHRIAANCAYDVLRSRARRKAREGSIDEAADGAQQFAGSDPGPDRLAAGGEVRQRLQAAMARLSTLERSAFTLRHLEGMSIAEIAQALDLEGESAKQSVFRAVRKVRAALAEHAPRAEGAKA